MERSEVFEKVKEIVSPYALDTESIAKATNDSRFLDDFQINSARLIDVIISFEDEFNIEIDDDSAGIILTMGEATDLICAEIKK